MTLPAPVEVVHVDGLSWLDSTTTVETRRWSTPPNTNLETESTQVTHRADFAVQALVPDMLAEYSAAVTFKPDLVRAKWIDGVLVRVVVSGPRRLKSGEVSANAASHRKREFRSYRGPLDRNALPAAIAQGLTAYERAVAGVAANGGDHE